MYPKPKEGSNDEEYTAFGSLMVTDALGWTVFRLFYIPYLDVVKVTAH